MRKQVISFLLSLFLVCSIVAPTFAAIQVDSTQKKLPTKVSNVGPYIIKFKDAATGQQVLSKRNKKAEKWFKHLSSHVTTTLTDAEAEDLKNDPNVAYIEKDSIVKKTSDTVTENVYQIHVPEVQEQGIDGAGVNVAILDTGINTKSPELNLAGGASFVPNDASLEDTNGHGTFVAGILAALKDNQGLVGVAPGVNLYDVKVLDSNGTGTYSQVIQGIEWAVDHHIDIVAMSFAGNDYSAALEEATQLAYNNGIILIAATGNDSANSVAYPAKFSSVIAVGAVDGNNQFASFSNTGAEVDLVAPGISIQGLSLNNNQYTSMSGTSMAVPQVAGIAALIKEKNKNLTNQDVRHVLENSSTNLGDITKYGHGLVNASNAITLADQTISSGQANQNRSGQSGVTQSVYDSLNNVSAATSYSLSYDSVALNNVNLKPDISPFSIGSNNEQISPISGSLSLKVTDLTLPGRNGLSFSLTRIYDSEDAHLYGMDINATDTSWMYPGQGVWYNTIYTALYSSIPIKTYNESLFPIGRGWSWNIPSIETKVTKYGQINKYLHLPGKGTYQINTYTNALIGYPWKDLSISTVNIQINGQIAVTKVHSIHGIDEYFNSNGVLLQISDPYGNTIQFSYQYDGTYNRDLLHSITDAVGNTISISYSTSQVILTQGNKTVQYNKGSMGSPAAEILSSVKDAAGRLTSYEYSYKDASFNFLLGQPLGFNTSNPYGLLTEISHPTGAKTKYTYEDTGVYRKIGRDGFVQAYRIKSREDRMYAAGSTIPDISGHKDFVYSGDMGSSYGSDYTFSITVNDGLKTTTYTNNKHFVDSATPDVFKTTNVTETIIDIVPSETGNIQRTTKQITMNGYTQGYSVPNSISMQYQQTVNNTTSLSQAITVSKMYDPYGNVTSETNPVNTTTTYIYDPNSHLLMNSTEPISPNQTRYTEYTRNDKGSVLTINVRDTNASGTPRSQKSFTYDPTNGNLLTTTIYDDNNRQTLITDQYNSSPPYNSGFLTNRIVNVTDVDGNQRTVTQALDYYTDTGRIKGYTDGRGNTTSYIYDNLNRVTQETFQDGSFANWTYDDTNNKMTYREPHLSTETGVVSTTTWNQLGWKTSEGISGAGITSYGYDAYGRQTTVKDAIGHSTTFTYDNWGREIQHQYPDGFSSFVQYDDINHKKISTDGEGNNIKETFDPMGRTTLRELQKKGAGAYLNLAGYTYDYAGNVLTLTDSNGYTTTYTYDILSRLKSVQEPNSLSNLTQYTYSLAGNLKQIQYADNSIVQKEYDELGRLIKKTDPAGQVDKYFYDGNNELTKHVDHNGVSATNDYDNRNRLWHNITPQETVTYSYFSSGRRKTMQDGTGTTSYAYDPSTGQLKTVTLPDGKQISYQYDGTLGNVQTITDPFGVVSAFGYDAENRLTGVGPSLNNWDESYANPNSYNKNNMLVSAVQRNGVTTTYGYDWVRVNSVTQTKTGGAVINNFGYGYDLNNNVTSKSENGASYSYTYDQDNRISTSTQFNEQYTYDARGNRQTLQTNSQPNLTGASYTYDDRNRLTSVTLDNGSTVTYQYNGDGLLTQRTENGQTTRYYYNGTQLIAEGVVANGTVTQKASYIRGHGLVTRVDGSGNKTYYLKNGHGDIVGLLDGAGNTLNTYSYDMWGNPLTTSEQIQQPFRYSGEFYDSTTGLQYLKSRWYDPSIGRFINKDTYEGDINNPLSLNLYTYSWNNPLRYVDPSGHNPFALQNYILGAFFEGLAEAARRYVPVIPAIEGIVGYDAFTNRELSTNERLESVGKAFTYSAGFVAAASIGGSSLSSTSSVKTISQQVDDEIAEINAIAAETTKGYRYVSEGELNVINKIGTIPNTDRAGNLKDVFVSPVKYDTVTGAEKGLQIGKQNPFGATESPMYRVEFDINAVKYRYGGNVEGGAGIELITEQPIPVDLGKIFKLK